MLYSAPGPPSSQSPSEAYQAHSPYSSSRHTLPGAAGGCGRSVQSPRSNSQMAVLQAASHAPLPRRATAHPQVGTLGAGGGAGGGGDVGAQSPPS